MSIYLVALTSELLLELHTLASMSSPDVGLDLHDLLLLVLIVIVLLL
jgi:hypothetical protein